MKSIKLSEKIIIDKPQADIFDYTQDYSTRLHWDTFLIKAQLLNGATQAGIGVRAYCVAKNGLGMETEYISFQPPKATAITMTKGPWLFTSFSGSWTFKALSPRQTQVIFIYSFRVRFPFSLFRSLVRRQLGKNVRQRLLDLKQCMEKS